MFRSALSTAIHAALVASSLAAPAVFAQSAPAEDASQAKTLDAVTVTARKREETLQEVPIAVTAFTADALDRLGTRDIADLDAQVPNLTIYAARGSSSTLTTFIRGVGQADPLWGVDPGVGLYLDDVYIARPQGALLDVFDVERIEVLRGPQGTLYGKNTIGGAIKYISRGLPTEFDGSASVTVGNYGQLDVKAAIGGPIAANGGLRARLAVAKLDRDGFGENRVTGADVSDKDVFAVRGQLGAFVNDNLDIQFAFDMVDDQSGVRGAQMLEANRFNGVFFPALGAFPPLADRYDVRNGMPNINDTTLEGASATLNWRATEDLTLKYVLAKRQSDTETNIDFDTTPAQIADVRALYADEQVSHELQANWDGGGRSRGVIGLYAFDGEAGGQVLNNFFNLSFGDTQGTVFTESVALYADWTFDLSERLSLDLGARYTDEDKRAKVLNRCYTSATFTTLRDCTPAVLTDDPAAANFDRTINFKNTSPKIALNFDLSDNVMLYGLASRGFKSGGYNIRAQATLVPRSALPFDDEVVDSFEVGAKMGLLDQRLFLNLAAFHNKYEDIQLSVFTANPAGGFFGDFTNAGKGTVQGLEAEYQWLLSDAFTVSGNLAWLDAEYDEFLFAGVDIANEQQFTNAPEFSGAINLEWRTAVGDAGQLTARVGYSYQSEVIATTEIIRSNVPPAAPFGRPPISQDGYGLVTAGVVWQSGGPWSVSLQGTNLTDKEYLTTGYNLAQALGVYTGFYGAPRQYSLSVRYDF
ncbi:TonB-dependent receptor [Silanimonas sp.]|jgi:iron complex outermembrane receptor protein|uniref:TonB-dependent receptor n=1 Tax=Silanimonas sp. TaxID=1929290 RepID=UPI0037C5D759